MEKEAARFRRLSETWSLTVEEVRKLDQFQDFLRPKSLAMLQQAACDRLVVILNANPSGCDANDSHFFWRHTCSMSRIDLCACKCPCSVATTYPVAAPYVVGNRRRSFGDTAQSKSRPANWDTGLSAWEE